MAARKRDPNAPRQFRASASAVGTASQCLRKWAARALGGVRVESDALVFGNALHKAAEDWLTHGTPPDCSTPWGALFLEGIPHLPKPGTCEVEREIQFNLEGIPWVGYIDFLVPTEHLIGDHKTSSDPKRWGLTPETLPKDLQACTYAYAVGWPVSNLRWVYYSKKSRSAYPVEAQVERSAALDRLMQVVPLTLEMRDLYDAHPAQLDANQLNQLPNNPSACDGTGRGCDFASQCQIYKPVIPAHDLIRRQENMSNVDDRLAALKAKIEASKNGATPVVNPPEAEKALEETKAEVAGTETPKAEESKKRSRKTKADATDAPDVESLIALLKRFGGTVTINVPAGE